MKRIRLKYAITDFGETLYEVELEVSHQAEEPVVKRFHKYSGKTRVARPATEAQTAHRHRFSLAIAYAKTAVADAQVRAHYEEMARRQGKQPWGAAVSHYLSGNDLLPKK